MAFYVFFLVKPAIVCVSPRYELKTHIDLNAEFIDRRFNVLMYTPFLVRKRLSHLGSVGVLAWF